MATNTTTTSTTSSGTDTDTTTFQTSTEMESLQIHFGQLRVLRSNEEDEASFRELMYEHYDRCLEVLTTTSSSTGDAIASAERSLYSIDGAFRNYFDLLVSMERIEDDVAARDCLHSVRVITRVLEDALLAGFVEGGEGGSLRVTVARLRGDEKMLRDAVDDMVEAMDYCSHDGILNRGECERVLRAMAERREQVERRLHRILMAVYDAQEVARRLCFVAAEFLRGSRVRDETGIETVCEWVERIGDRVGDHSRYIDTYVHPDLVCDND